jgi:hypothetical protein
MMLMAGGGGDGFQSLLGGSSAGHNCAAVLPPIQHKLLACLLKLLFQFYNFLYSKLFTRYNMPAH